MMRRSDRALIGMRGGAQLWLVFGVLVALGAVSFALQNSVPVTVNFLFFRFDSSLAMVLLMAFGGGVLAAGLLSWPLVLRERWTAARERKRASASEEETRQLRQQIAKPVSGPVVNVQTDARLPEAGTKTKRQLDPDDEF